MKEVLQQDKDNAPALLIQAHCDLVAGRWPESIAAARRALRLDPGLWGAYQILGDAYLKTGKEDLAREAYVNEAELRAGAEPAIKLGDFYFNRKEYAAAARWYENIPSGHPTYPLSRIYLAGCYAQQKEYNRARTIYLTAAENFPEYSQFCFFNLARISLRQGREEEARDWLDKIEDPEIREKISSDSALSGIAGE